jgi:hypothetical protein
MSDDEDLDNDSEGIKNLRKQFAELKKERTAEQEELNKFRLGARTASVTGFLKAKGIPESAAKLYTGEDTSEDAVGKWLEDFADVFQPKSGTDENAQNAQRVSDASQGASSTQQNGTDLRVLGDIDEIRRALDTLPREELEKMGLVPPDVQYGPRR